MVPPTTLEQVSEQQAVPRQPTASSCCQGSAGVIQSVPGSTYLWASQRPSLLFLLLAVTLPGLQNAQLLPSPLLSQGLTKCLSCLGWAWACHPPASASQGTGILGSSPSLAWFWLLGYKAARNGVFLFFFLFYRCFFCLVVIWYQLDET